MGRLNSGEFYPHRSLDPDTRLRQVEDYLSQFGGRLPLTGTQPTPTAPTGTVIAGNSGGGVTLPIPEASVVFDPSFGHSHDGANSHTVPLTGDATGTNAAVVVAKGNGITLPTPVAGNNDEALFYDHGTLSYVLRATRFKQKTITVANSPYAAIADDTMILVDAVGGPVTVTLPTSIADKVYVVKKLDAVNNVTIATTGGQLIDGATPVILAAQYASISVTGSGTAWWIF